MSGTAPPTDTGPAASRLSAVHTASDGTVGDLTQPELWSARHLVDALKERANITVDSADRQNKEKLLELFRRTLQVFPQRQWRDNRTGRKLQRSQQTLEGKQRRLQEAAPAAAQPQRRTAEVGREVKRKGVDLDTIVIDKIEPKRAVPGEKTLTVTMPKRFQLKRKSDDSESQTVAPAAAPETDLNRIVIDQVVTKADNTDEKTLTVSMPKRFQLRRKSDDAESQTVAPAAAPETDLNRIVIDQVVTKAHNANEKTLTVVMPKSGSEAPKSVPRRPKIRRTTLMQSDIA